MRQLFYKSYGLVGGTTLRFSKLVMVIIALALPFLAQAVAKVIGKEILRLYISIRGGVTKMSPIDSVIIYLVLVTLVTVFYLLFVKLIEKRKINSMGLKIRKGTLFEYFVGYLMGIIMFSIAAILIFLSGNGELSFVGLGSAGISTFIVVIMFWGVQGASEEIMMRGYTLPVVGKALNVPFGIFISSTFFAFLHIWNNGITTLSLINLSLFGLFAAFYALYSKNIWGICALHSAWNFAQGNIWGFSVSGNEIMGNSIMESKNIGDNLINGGVFGPEGGLCVTLVLVVGIIGIIFLQKRKSKREGLDL